MDIGVPAGTLVGFCAALVRTTAWIVVCPPFNAPAVPKRVRVGLATAIAFVIAGDLRLADDVASITAGGFILALLIQALAGMALGFAVYALFAAIQAAGDLIDLQIGFSIGAVFDPLSGAQASPVGRLHQMLAIVLLLGLNGHVMVVSGYLRSVAAVPDGSIDLAVLGHELIRIASAFLVAAVEIALPVLAALFCTEVALGLIGKAAPQMNILVLGFAAKSAVALVLVGATLVLLPEATESVIGRAITGIARAFG
ncbi:MAG TPA: flagellar biosynthetic protein FliR [Ilumatobacter sp.]|nr:flagellar biosynthetic protein FliR [Ilumatobacter sp.]